MKRTLRIITDIISEPRAAFTELILQPNWFTVWLIIGVVLIGVGWAILPFSQQISHNKLLESGMDDVQIEQSRGMVEGLSFVGLLFTPVPLLLKWLIFASVFYFGARFLGSPEALKFKPMFAVVAYSELILVFSELINAALLLGFKQIDDVQDYTDLQVIPGLHLLFGDETLGIPLFTFLSQIQPFFIWYLVVLSLGVAVVANLNRRRAEFLVVFVWLAEFGFRVVWAMVAV